MSIVVILGPTGVGKTELSIALAKKMNAEIINADATQIYKEVKIGVAKISESEKQGVVHHMMDLVSLNEDYTVKDYQRDARAILDKLIKDNKNVVIVGGPGLYLKALLYDYRFSEESGSVDYSSFSNEELIERVNSIYPENDIHVNNRKRMERFLSHYDLTGEIIRNNEGKDKPLYDFTLIGLRASREELYEHLDKRVEIMMCDGLIEEARGLYMAGYTKSDNFIGYREFNKNFRGEIDVYSAMDEVKASTRKYAKRQYTFFKNQFSDIKWFDVSYDDFDKTIKKVETYLDSL